MARKHEVFWARVAEDDLISIIKYIHFDNPVAAKDNLKKIKSKASSLTVFRNVGALLLSLKSRGFHNTGN